MLQPSPVEKIPDGPTTPAIEMCIRDRYSIDAIATASGFKSRNTYYVAFNKLLGMTPVQYVMCWSFRKIFST